MRICFWVLRVRRRPFGVFLLVVFFLVLGLLVRALLVLVLLALGLLVLFLLVLAFLVGAIVASWEVFCLYSKQKQVMSNHLFMSYLDRQGD